MHWVWVITISAPEDKLQAIASLEFPHTLQQLEHYLGVTGWLRKYVSRYAQKSEPLQARKTLLSKTGPNAGNGRKAFAKIIRLTLPSTEELNAYESIQEAFKNPGILVHFSPERILFIDIDAAKGEKGFGAMIYHVNGELNYLGSKTDKKTPPPRTLVEPIMFLSRLLNIHEQRYWPTELEVACLIWVLRKVRHLVEASKHPTVIWTDHAATIGIVNQRSLSTTATDRLNLRLIQAAQYAQRFRLELHHKPGKLNTVPDALSRLPSKTFPAPNEPILDTFLTQYDGTPIGDAAYSYTALLIEMSDGFKTSLKEGYQEDSRWKEVINDIENNNRKKEEATVLPYELGNDGLLYSVNLDGSRRLCIPTSVVPSVFKMAHDDNGHNGFEKCMQRLHGLAIHKASRLLRKYIEGCPECARNTSPRHKPYGSMQPILTPPIPFYAISIDFIMALLLSPELCDCIMTIVCKFAKRITFIAGKTTLTAEEWATLLIDRLLIGDWGIPVVIFSDRDPKFLSDVWTYIFKRLHVQLLYTTAYHAQTNGAIERMNQTAEIFLRYAIASLPNVRLWPTVLPQMQAVMNSTTSATTGKTPHELAYGMKLNSPMELLKDNPASKRQDFTLRIDAEEAIKLAQLTMKRHYDRRHRPISFKVGDKVKVRLHKGYSIALPVSKKYGPQFAGPYKVLERIGRLAYRLELPEHWKVHPVISVAHLEPAKDDAFNRPQPDHPEPIYVDGDTENMKSFEVEAVLNKRERRRGRKVITEYLIRWVGYGPDYDVWYPLSALNDCKELVEEYEDFHRGNTLVRQDCTPHR
jgi:hypothetical protein